MKFSEGCWRRRLAVLALVTIWLSGWPSFEAVEYATLERVDCVNNRRLLDPIGNIPPAEAEANFFATLEKSDMAAQLRQISVRQTRCGSLLRIRLLLKKVEQTLLQNVEDFAGGQVRAMN
jgi:hypothetical protein